MDLKVDLRPPQCVHGQTPTPTRGDPVSPKVGLPRPGSPRLRPPEKPLVRSLGVRRGCLLVRGGASRPVKSALCSPTSCTRAPPQIANT
eukprot:121607-Pyramimonas_sp.AAC.1